MSQLSAFRSEINRAEPPRRHRVALPVALVAVLMLAVAGLAEMRLLSSFAADDFGSVLFQHG